MKVWLMVEKTMASSPNPVYYLPRAIELSVLQIGSTIRLTWQTPVELTINRVVQVLSKPPALLPGGSSHLELTINRVVEVLSKPPALLPGESSHPSREPALFQATQADEIPLLEVWTSVMTASTTLRILLDEYGLVLINRSEIA